MFSIQQNFKMSDVFKDMENFLEDTYDEVVDSLKATGIRLVDKARAQTKSEGGFGNITWNLRASIGCVVVRDSEIVFTYFPAISLGDEGHKNGIAYVQEIASLVDDGDIMLILVAGMDYASAVENRHGLDVISGSCEDFEDIFKSLIES
jgi:hypothetical protein